MMCVYTSLFCEVKQMQGEADTCSLGKAIMNNVYLYEMRDLVTSNSAR